MTSAGGNKPVGRGSRGEEVPGEGEGVAGRNVGGEEGDGEEGVPNALPAV